MPAPTNIDGATATELGPLPNSITQDVRDSGTTYTVWYKYTHSGADKVVGIWAYGGLGTYEPILEVSVDISGSPAYLGMSISHNRPVQFPVTNGGIYYLKVTTNDVNADPASLEISGEFAPTNETITNGLIAVNDDTEDFPVALFDAVDGTPISFKTNVVAGEEGAVLPSNGNVLYADTGGDLKLYNNQFNFLNDIPFTNVGGDPIINTNGDNIFYVLSKGTFAVNATLQKFASDGTAIGSLITLPLTGATGYTAFCINRDETIIYYAPTSTETTVKRFDLVNLVPLSDLLVDDPLYRLGPDFLNLDDDTIIMSFIKLDGTSEEIRRYDSAGTLQNTYSFGAAAGYDHMAYAIDDPISFWAWFQPSGGFSRFVNVQVSDGTLLADFQTPEFEVGVYDGSESASPPRFGHSQSCTFLITRVSNPSTLYVIVPNKRNDLGEAIPNPTFRTALLP